MAAAEANKPVLEFPTPSHEPVYKYFVRGNYGYSYVPTVPHYTPTTATTTTTATIAPKPLKPAPTVEPRTGLTVPSPTPKAPPPVGRSSCASHAVSELLTIDEALALVLERVEALGPEEVELDDGRRTGARRAVAARSSTCRRFRRRRWTASRCAPPTRRGRSRSSPASPPGVRSIARSAPGEAMAIATGGVVPEGADAVVPIEDVEDRDTEVVDRRRQRRRERPRPRRRSRRGRSRRAGRHAARPGARRRARSRRRLPRPLHPRPARGGGRHGHASCARPASRSAPARSTTRTASSWRRRSAARARRSSGCRRWGRRATRRARRSSAASPPTSSSRAAACRSASTTSSARPRPSSGSRRSSGGSRCGRESRSRSACAGRTLVFGLPGNPVSSLVGFELFVRPALLALQGLADPRPPFRPGRLARAVNRLAARDCAGAGAAAGRRRRGAARAADRAGIPHDRPGGDGGRARARSTWGRRARGRQRRLIPPL